MESFIGTIIMFAGNFAPQGWAFCDGSLLSISQYSAVFALLGTTYGGNGQTNFALPDLRGRVPLAPGQGPGLSNYVLGQIGGAEALTLLLSNLPAHTHTTPSHTHSFSPPASTGRPSTSSPTGATLAAEASNIFATTSNTTMLAGTTANDGAGMSGPAGSNLPVSNAQPYLGINFIICLEGIFPTRP